MIIGFVLFSIGMGYAIYFVFFRSTPPPTIDNTTSTDTSTNGTFPTIGSAGTTQNPTNTSGTSGDNPADSESIFNQPIDGSPINTSPSQTPDRITEVIDRRVVGVNTSIDTKFYNTQDGKFYRLDTTGTPVPISDQVFYNVQNVVWSPQSNSSIIEYPDGSNIYYNFDTKEQVTLPRHWEGFSFSPGGEQIAAKSVGMSPENRWLISANPNGSEIKLIEPLGVNDKKVTVDWSPNRQVIAFARTGEALGDDRQQILLLGQNRENFKGLIVEGRGLETKWSKQGTRLLHSVYNANSDFKPELWIVDATPDSVGANRKLLNVATWANKCTMADERFAYCGVPDKLDTGAGFAPLIANNIADHLYRIDTVTGLKTEIPLDRTYTIDTITVSPDGNSLLFTDKNQAGLFKVNL